MLENADIYIAIRYKVRYLQSKGATVNVGHYDLDAYFQDHEFSNVNFSKTVRASKKSSRTTFIGVDISHRMEPFWILFSVNFIDTFKVKHFINMHLL